MIDSYKDKVSLFLRIQVNFPISIMIMKIKMATTYPSNGVAGTLKKLRTSKGDYWIKQCFSSSASFFKMGTPFKGINLLPTGANSFL